MTCDHDVESGSLLMSGMMHWSPKEHPGFFAERLFPEDQSFFGRHHYFARPYQRVATLCRKCAICTVAEPLNRCAHEIEEGSVLPDGKLRWFGEEGLFEPTFFFAFTNRGVGGTMTEELFDPGFSLGGARCAGELCRKCGMTRIFLGRSTLG